MRSRAPVPHDDALGALVPSVMSSRCTMPTPVLGVRTDRNSGGGTSPVLIASSVADARVRLPCSTWCTASAIAASATASRQVTTSSSAAFTDSSVAVAGTTGGLQHRGAIIDRDSGTLIQVGECQPVDRAPRVAVHALTDQHGAAAVVDERVEQVVVEATLEAAAKQISERLPLADAIEDVGREPNAVGAQVNRHGRIGGAGAMRVAAGAQDRRRCRVRERRRVDKALRLARALLLRPQVLDPAKATKLHAARMSAVSAQRVEPFARESGDPRVETMGGEAERLAEPKVSSSGVTPRSVASALA